MATPSEIVDQIAAKDVRTRWLLSSPALVIVLLAAVGPLLIVLVYSFLAPGAYGGVTRTFSPEAWISVILERDIFDNTLSLADANLVIFLRTVFLSLATTLLTLLFGFPTAYFIATRPDRSREIWLFLITIPFWTNLLIRTFAIQQLIRNEGVVNSLLLWLGVIRAPIEMMQTNFAILLGMTYVFFPLMVLPLFTSIEKLDFRLVEAGYDLYATRARVLWRIVIPQVAPGIVAGSILVFIPSLGAYVTPRVLGGGKSLMVGNLIDLQFGQGKNWPLGASLSMTLLAIVLVALLVYVRVSDKSGDEQNG